jgi:hypothetical protein
MISVSWIHIFELITELHHPLQYRIILTIGHMTKYDIATQGKSTTKQQIPSSVDDPRHAYYPTCNWLGDVPSSHQCHRNHRHLPRSLLYNLTKLIARDKDVSTFWIVLANHLNGKHWICILAVARKGSSLVYFLWKPFFSVQSQVESEGEILGEWFRGYVGWASCILPSSMNKCTSSSNICPQKSVLLFFKYIFK